jgi:hypothetical protein
MCHPRAIQVHLAAETGGVDQAAEPFNSGMVSRRLLPRITARAVCARRPTFGHTSIFPDRRPKGRSGHGTH